MSRRVATAALLALCLGVPASGPVGAQDLGPSTGGLAALDQALRYLGHHKRVLMIGAHPDDEDTELLTVLVRGMGAEAAYLSLTRGEGGQNLIGPELGDALGVLRTEELLAARRLDGARQFFTRTWDFGYSKGLPDTWKHWPRDSVLKDVVRVVRAFRPQVMVSVFSGTSRDGHGQHQAAGWVAHEAFRVAGDPAVFPELARDEGIGPWAPVKLFQAARFDRTGPVLTLEGGVLDRAVGQSYLQIAMRGRSLHRSQDMGVSQPLGPSAVQVRLLEDRSAGGGGTFFSGIDTSLASLAPPSGNGPETRLAAIGDRLHSLRPWRLDELPALRRELGTLLGEERGGLNAAAADQLRRMDDVLFLASELLCDAVSSSEHLVPGDSVVITVSCWNASREPQLVAGRVRVLGGDAGGYGPHQLAPGALQTDTLWLRVPADARPTTPYYLERPKMSGAALYQWPGTGPRSAPFESPPVIVEFELEAGGRAVREAVYRYIDQAVGEVRRPLTVVPAVTVTLAPVSGLWPIGDLSPRRFDVIVRAMTRDSLALSVGLAVPPGWRVVGSTRVSLTDRRPEHTMRLAVRPVPGASEARHRIRAVATDQEGRTYSSHLVRIEYAHTRARQIVEDAAAEVSVARIGLSRARAIAYVRGAADRVPEALQSMGLRPVLLSADSLARGDLSRFGTIVIGPRAYEIEPALAEASGRLVEFARRGGSVLVQYQQQVFFRGGFAPYPLSLTESLQPGQAPFRVGAPRVAEEDAPVRPLHPGHPVFRTPNRLDKKDWDGWVQERGLYFARAWDSAWTPLLEMADAGEPPLRGGLLVARVGKGHFVYTGLSFFRQLPAGVPGAARLFVNLLALGPRGDGH